jgi:hypothetical protein
MKPERGGALLAWRVVRAPIDTLHAPMIPASLEWINVASLRMDKQLGRPVLIEFWDFCRANSLRTLPYVRAWHERYAAAGLRVISVHAPGYPPGQDPAQVRAAVQRLGIEHPVVLDTDFHLWRDYGNEGWPARYLFDRELKLHSFHYGEGAYDETEAEIAELLELGDVAVMAPLRPEDAPGAALVVPTPEQQGAWSGPYEAGAVWAVLEPDADAGAGAAVVVNGARVAVPHAGCFALVEHERHSAGVLELDVAGGVTCHAVQFTAGLA